MRRVVVATHNAHKGEELQRIFDAEGLDAQVTPLSAFPPYPDPDETEWTFEGNALIKARAAVAQTGEIAVADDSGIEVDLLNNMPGVRSARWSGVGATDEANLRLLVAQLADTADEQRTARFVCAMALVTPSGREEVVRGVMPGHVVLEPRGSNGFGYDPMFVADGQTRTNGELSSHEKDAISHRARAAHALVPYLADVLKQEGASASPSAATPATMDPGRAAQRAGVWGSSPIVTSGGGQ